MKTCRHIYLDFPDFTQERCYEITSKVTFQNGIKEWFESGSLLAAKPEIPQSKYVIVCDNVKRIFYEDGSYKEIGYYSVIHVVPNDLAVYYGRFDTKEAADERCAELNKIWESVFLEEIENFNKEG